MSNTLKAFKDLGINVRDQAGEQRIICPECSPKRKKHNQKLKDLAVNVSKGTYFCHHCGWNGAIHSKKSNELERFYVRPQPYSNDTGLSDKLLNYMRLRGISPKTLTDAKVGEGIKFIPKDGKKMNCILFGYYKDGILVNIKARSATKGFTQSKGAEKIFFKIDDIKDTDEAIITEGEMDALSYAEAGYKNAVSVPDGAPPLNASSYTSKFEFLDNSIEYFKDKKRIYLATDNDPQGIKLREELARRLGYEKCWIVSFNGKKDPNELLMSSGSKALADTIVNAEPYPLKGVITVDRLQKDIYRLYDEGVEKGKTIGFSEFDELISFLQGNLTVVTGVPTHGKSNFIEMVITLLMVRYGSKFGIFSPEHYPNGLHFSRLARIFTGLNFFKSPDGKRMDKDMLGTAIKFFMEKLFFIRPEDEEGEEDFTLANILASFKTLVFRYGIEGFLIDPWNMIEHDYGRSNENIYTQRALKQVKSFVKQTQTMGFIIAHPIKMKKTSGYYDVPSPYDISGSANWFNMPDNVMTVYRNEADNTVEIHVQKVKMAFAGKKGLAEFKFERNSSRYYPANQKPFNGIYTPDSQQIEIKLGPYFDQDVDLSNIVDINREFEDEDEELPF